MGRAMLQVGSIVQTGLNFINPVQNITLWQYAGTTTSDSGQSINAYNQSNTTARVQPVTQQLMFKYNLEFGHTYKRFYILLDSLTTVNRNLSTNSDYIKFNNLYYRVMRVEDNFDTQWLHVIGMQTNQEPT